MPHTLDENDDNVCQNMVSNLPLLFAAGYPTSLEKITESQLEQFIPFMVQCSLGNIQINGNIEYDEPEWWPEDTPFSIPLIRTDKTNWHERLKQIVIICYSFHKSVFLLRFCNELASYQPESLRFINNYNSTTSLFDRVSNKLLVTFRNENMLYDQLPINNKKTLLPRVQSSQTQDNNNERMVEAALFDIYLCDNCEAELYSLEAYKEHEKICEADDDVIFCGTEEYVQIDANLQKQTEFLQMFNLTHSSNSSSSNCSGSNLQKPKTFKKRNNNNNNNGNEILTGSPQDKLRRLPRRSRAVMALSKCPNLAISSPAGQQIFKLSKTVLSKEYLLERLDRMGRFCQARPLVNDGSNRPKFLYRKYNYSNISHNFRRPPDYFYHFYKFPRRQFAQRNRWEAFLCLTSNEFKQCKPLTISVKRLTQQEIDTACEKIESLDVELSDSNTAESSTSKVVDFIDLCSSDEEDGSSSNSSSNNIDSERQNYDGSLSQMAATPITNQQVIPAQQLEYIQPSVILFSNLTKTAVPLYDHNRQQLIKYQNVENDCSFLNGAKSSQLSSIAMTNSNSKDTPSLGPDIVIERLTATSKQIQQVSIDLT